MRQARRRNRDQAPRQVLRRLVGETGEDHLIELIGLRLDRVDDPGVAMAMGDHPPGGNRIQQTAMLGLKPRAFAAIHARHHRADGVLGEGMPYR